MTEKLYFTDSYLTEFDAKILEVIPRPDSHWNVILDRTAFYPESGGQPFDTGWINDIPVIEVQLNDQEHIVHTLTQEPTGTQAHGQINWQRRFDHMQQHSGEHILSDAFLKVLGAKNVGFHLGEEAVQIDVTLEVFSHEQAEQVEDYVNQVIFANQPVHIHFPSSKELSQLPIRKTPPKTEGIRVIEIENSDCCPCGGTHVQRTGEVGLLKIRSWEKKKQGIRIDFVCGNRALRDYRSKNYSSFEISSLLSTPVLEIAPAVALHLKLHENALKELASARRELTHHLAQILYDEAEEFCGRKMVVQILEDQGINLKDLARELTQEPQTIALLGNTQPAQGKCNVIFSCSTVEPISMQELLKDVLPLIKGQGGGNATSAQGGGTQPENLLEALRLAQEILKKRLLENP